MENSKMNPDSKMFPVLKFDLNNRLIYANVAALPLMKQWGCEINEKLPSSLVSQHPELFHSAISHYSQDLSIQHNEYIMHFSLVPFPEANYIGMYGYCIELFENYSESKKSEENLVNVPVTQNNKNTI
jgi:hypothetical protein